MNISLSWLLGYIKEVYDALPDDLNVIEALPEQEDYLDDRFEEEIYRIIAKKKHHLLVKLRRSRRYYLC